MSEYVLCASSTTDLTPEHLKERNIKWLSFHFSIDGKEYLDDMGKTIPPEKFYQSMRDGCDTKTWQVNSEEYCEFFREFLSQGKDIVYLSLSSGLSGSYNSAVLAANELEGEFPERKIFVIDTLGASSGYGMLADTLADMRDERKSAEELYNWAEENKLKLHHWFFSTDLTFYVKGGRVSKTSGMVGNLLGICPLLNMNTEGKLIPRQKVRTKRKVMAEILNKMILHAQNGTEYSGKCYICHSDCADDANELAKKISEIFTKLSAKPSVYNIGPTIGSHSGPGTLALFFYGDERTM